MPERHVLTLCFNTLAVLVTVFIALVKILHSVFWNQRNNNLFDETVAAVPDGLKAWETLKERPHNIDLVLTEVELPSISGYALLTLIVEHDMCKNIPVISMFS